MENSIDVVRVACDVIVRKNGVVLMGKRGHVFGEGSWALPGGHLEVNERVEDCARRELHEEVGIVPKKIELIGIINDVLDLPDQKKHYIRFVFEVNKFSGKIVNKEPDKCFGWEWFNQDKIPEPKFIGHIKIIRNYLINRNKFFYE